jgi:cell division protein FtsB
MAVPSIIVRSAWIVLGLVGAVMVFSMFFPQYRRYIKLQEQVDAIDAEYALEEERLKRLKQNQDEMRDNPEFVERVAREELGLAKPGETIIKFVGKPAPLPPAHGD